MENCTFGTLWGILWTEHTVLAVIGVVVELVVIGFAIKESLHRRKEAQAHRRAAELLRRFAGALQMAKANPAVEQVPSLITQFNDLGQRYENWDKQDGHA